MIGIFDSGVGGLGIYNEIRKLMPNEQILYLADTANCPYGEKSEQQIKQICLNNSRFLINKGADIIVVACNTASTVALQYLRLNLKKEVNSNLIRHRKSNKVWDAVTFVGVVPVVKTCSEVSKNKRIGVLATKRTAESQYLKDLVENFCPSTPRLLGINPAEEGFKVYYQAANELVEMVENLSLSHPEQQRRISLYRDSSLANEAGQNDKLLRKYLQPFIYKKVDTIALGCTHFPFLRQQIEEIMGPNVRILDSNGAVARQVEKIADSISHMANRKSSITNFKNDRRSAISNKHIYQFYTSGDKKTLINQITNLIELDKNNFEVREKPAGPALRYSRGNTRLFVGK